MNGSKLSESNWIFIYRKKKLQISKYASDCGRFVGELAFGSKNVIVILHNVSHFHSHIHTAKPNQCV